MDLIFALEFTAQQSTYTSIETRVNTTIVTFHCWDECMNQLTTTFICATSYRLSVGTACYLYIGSRLLQLRRISWMLALCDEFHLFEVLFKLCQKKWSPYDIMSPKINHNTSHQPSVSSSSITVVWNMSYSRITWRQPNSELKPNEPQSFNQFEKKSICGAIRWQVRHAPNVQCTYMWLRV